MKPARRIERLDARPCLSPEEERALLEHLRREEDEPYDGPVRDAAWIREHFGTLVTEPPRGMKLPDALFRVAEGARRNIEDRIRAAIPAYPDWSRAERARMGAVTADVLAWCRDGTGGPECFAAWLWRTYLKDAVEETR
jgi:hypothetical protein